MPDHPDLIAKLRYWSELREDFPNSALTWYERGGVLLDLFRFDEALADYSRALALDPLFVAARYCRALALEKLDRADEAVEEYSIVIEQDPSFVSAYNNRGILYMQANQFREALEDFHKTSELDPLHARSRYNKGLVHGSLRQYEEAIQAFSEAITLKPTYERAFIMRAKAYAFLDRMDLARDDLQTASHFGRESAEFYAVQAWIFLKDGNHSEFIRSFDRAKEIDPECEELNLIRSHLEEVQAATETSPHAVNPLPTATYVPEDAYREGLRPGLRPDGQLLVRGAIAAFLLIDSAESFTQAVKDHPLLLNLDFQKSLEILGETNLPLKAHCDRAVPALRQLFERLEEKV